MKYGLQESEWEKWSKTFGKIRHEFSSTCEIDERTATLHLAIWLSWTAKSLSAALSLPVSLVYIRIVSHSLCYIISQITWERWRTSMLLHLQSKMEARLWLQADFFRCLSVWVSFMRMETYATNSNGCQVNSSSLIKWLFQIIMCCKQCLLYLFGRSTKIQFPPCAKKEMSRLFNVWHLLLSRLHDHSQSICTITTLD